MGNASSYESDDFEDNSERTQNDSRPTVVADELYMAARLDRQADLRLLLRRPGADPNGRTTTGRTPLIGAALGDSWEAAQLLLDSGARPDEPDAPEFGGCTPLMVAAQRDAQAVAGVLLHAGAEADAATEPDGQTALMWCCQSDLPRMASLLIARGACIDRHRRRDSATPLMLAARNNAVLSARLLLELGAQIDSRGPAGFTALMVCALVDAVDVAERLLAAGADRLAADAAGRTALHVCARHGSIRVARLLLDSGVDPNSAPTMPQSGGHTPTTLAAAHGQWACLRLLVRRGADYRHRCADGSDIQQLAEKSGCSKTAELANALLAESNGTPRRSGISGTSQQDDFGWLHTHEDGSLRPELKPALAAILKTVSEDEALQDDKASLGVAEASGITMASPLQAVNTATNSNSQPAATSNNFTDSQPELDNIIEQLIIKKRVVTKQTSGDRVVSVREDLIEILVDCGELSETVHFRSGADAMVAANAARSQGLRSSGSQFYPKIDY